MVPVLLPVLVGQINSAPGCAKALKGLPSNGLRFSRAPARATSIDRERDRQETSDLDRTGRGVGWMRLLGRHAVAL